MESASCSPGRGGWSLPVLVPVLVPALVLVLIAAGVGGCRRPRTPPAALPVAPATVQLAGRALDQAGHAVPDARVLAAGAAETRTDLEGRFVLSGLRPGSYRLLVEAAGFATFETATLSAPTADLVIRLPGTALSVGGRVESKLDLPGGESADAGVVGATVRLVPETGGPIRETQTRADRSFAFGGLGAGRYWVAASAGRRAARAVATTVTEAGGERLTLVLVPAGGCAGRVVDDAGVAIPGLRVRVERAALALGEDPLPTLAETDRDGRFAVTAVPPGWYRIAAAAAGYLQRGTPIVSVTIEGPAPSVTVEMVRGARLAGRVVDPHGGGAAGAQIRCVASGIEDLSILTGPLLPAAEAAALPPGAGRTLGATRFARADREGRFTIPDLIPGRYRLDVALSGAEPLRSDELALAPGERRDVGTLALRAGIALAGRVADEGGIPIEGARVAIDPTGMPDGSLGQTTLTDGGGRFSLALRAGSYRVSARAPGRGVAQTIVSIGATAPAPLELRLARAEARLEGMVRDSGGRPLARARLVVRVADTDAAAGGAQTDAGGHFSVAALPAGDVRVEIAHPDYPATTVGAVTGTFAMLTVPFPGAVTGEVRARNTGALVGRGRVEGVGPGGAETRADLRRAGTFRLTRLVPGRWRLTVTAPGYRVTEQELEVPASTTLGEASVSNLRVEVEPG